MCDISEAIETLASAGLEVCNDRGGYICLKNDEWIHQSCYRSTFTGVKEEVISSFLSESGL